MNDSPDTVTNNLKEHEKKKRIYRNKIRCLVCDKVIESTHRHDWVSCGCENKTFVDGGHEYIRVGGVDISQIEFLTEYVPEDTFIWHALREGKSLDGGAFVPMKLDEINDDHLRNIALHLRNRYKRVESDHTDMTAMMYVRDQELLCDVFLPELEKRGLTEVTEEIPWR
jgi:hypothetical protein